MTISMSGESLAVQALVADGLDTFFWPSSRAGVMSAWWGHVPFAHWLVGAIRPDVVVELGTHNGVSFAAFCEAAQRGKLPTKCFAVDTWEGDEHAGHYSEKVYAGLSLFIASRYAGFAELLRTTFDEAVPYFADGSIDLLHIDGLHTYDAVKRDFETWLPKLSSRAVVLFHDTNVRERDFGVWQLWAELRQRYPGFEFTHAHGLGVLLVGPHAPSALASVAQSVSDDPAVLHAMRARFAQLGLAFVEADTARRYIEHASELEKANGHLNHVVVERQAVIDNLQSTQAQLAQQMTASHAEADRARPYIEHAAELEKANGHLTRIAAERQAIVDDLQAAHAKLAEQLTASNAEADRARPYIEHAAELEKANGHLTRIAAERQAIVDDLQAAHAKLTEQLAATRAEADRARAFVEHAAELEKTNRNLTRVAAEKQEANAQHRSQIAQLSGELEAAHRSSEELAGKLRMAEAAHQAFAEDMYRSTSWQVTRPMRALSVRRLVSSFRKRTAENDTSRVTRVVGTVQPDGSVTAVLETTPVGSGATDEVEVVALASLAEAEEFIDRSDIALIESSGLFDADFYAARARSMDGFDSPVAHYLAIGEAAGMAPSEAFDPVYYRRRHRDLAVLPPGELLLHYIRFGCAEGRVAQSSLRHLALPTDRLDPDKPCMVVAAHEATRTGAAILSWNLAAEFSRRYNVVVLLRRGGPTEDTFADVACAVLVMPGETGVQSAELEILAERLIEVYRPTFVVANSVESRFFIPAFEQQGVPCVSLVHEFSVSVRPLGVLCELFERTSRIVFSAQIVADAALRDYSMLAARDYAVLPQGPCKLPRGSDSPVTELRTDGIRARLEAMQGDLASLDAQAFLVVGMGTITSRKGVEFFISAADRVRRGAPGRKIVFAWIGKCYDFDAPYLQTLIEQVERCGLDDAFAFWGELGDLDPVYARADALFLCSRLDPLPNVAIDASLAGVPVVCFAQASGIADILAESAETSRLVVPYLDAAGAAEVIVELVESPLLRDRLRAAVRRTAVERFDMETYARSIEGLALDAVAARRRVSADEAFLLPPGNFNAALYAGRALDTRSRSAHVAHYLQASSLAAPRGRPRTGYLVRRPLEGFHPLIYAGEAAGYDESRGPDPLVHYLQAGRPEGRWAHPILRPPEGATAGTVPPSLKLAIHAHFHYPELFSDFLGKLRSNATPADLYLTTTSEAKAEELQRIVADEGVSRAQVLLVPNAGRDIGPMLCSLPAAFFDSYDVVGHFHGKRSPHVEEAIGGAWREFLWQHLIGDAHPMMDVVARAFAADPVLGLVFAEDPHLNDWDQNRAHADRLAEKMGFDPLPTHLDFPQGTMFWARPAVLRPMLELGLVPSDFPREPLPIDGTFLHALERLLPFAAAHTGHTYAATYVERHRR